MADVPSTPVVPTSGSSAGSETPTPAGAVKTASDGVTPPAAAPVAPVAPPKYKFDLKVDGKADSKEYTHDELVAMLQKNSAADQRLAQLAGEKKAIATALARLKEDPFAALADPALGGLDLEALAAQRLFTKWQQEELAKSDPAAAERARLEQELQVARAEKTKIEQQWQAEQTAKVQQQIQQETMTTYQAAIQKLGVQPDEDLISTMLDINLKALDYGIDLNADQLALAAKEHLESRSSAVVTKHRSRWGGMEGEDLLKDLGDDTVKKVQAALLSRARAAVGRPAPVVQKPGVDDDAPKQKREFVSDAIIRQKLLGWR